MKSDEPILFIAANVLNVFHQGSFSGVDLKHPYFNTDDISLFLFLMFLSQKKQLKDGSKCVLKCALAELALDVSE